MKSTDHDMFPLPCRDYLKIEDDNNVTVGLYCSYQTGKSVIVGGDYTIITFHSNHEYYGHIRGFWITFTVVQPSKYK